MSKPVWPTPTHGRTFSPSLTLDSDDENPFPLSPGDTFSARPFTNSSSSVPGVGTPVAKLSDLPRMHNRKWKHLIRLLWHYILAPGSLQYRCKYEVLRSGPLLLCFAFLFIPTTTDGKLDVWLFSCAFHTSYAAVAELFGLCAFGLLYPLPHVLPTLCVMAVTLGLQATLVYLSVNNLSGRALQFAIPASLLAVATVYLIFLAWHAFFPRRPAAALNTTLAQEQSVSVVVRDPVKLSRPRSKTYALTPNGLEPARTLKRPATQQVLPTLNRVVAFWVLLAGFTVLLAAYYWCQVYTGSIMLDVTAAVGAGSSYQFIVIALFDLSMRGFTLLMATAVKIQVLRRAGVPKNKAEALHIILIFSVQLLHMVYERFLFLSFTTLWSVAIAIAEGIFVKLCFGPLRMTKWFFNARRAAYAGCSRRCGVRRRTSPHYDAFLHHGMTAYLFKKIADHASLALWLLSVLWLRFGYNSSVYPYGTATVSSDSLHLYIQYSGMFVLAEVVLVVFTRCMALHKGVEYFDTAVEIIFREPLAVLAFVFVGTHVMQDVYVAQIILEPHA